MKPYGDRVTFLVVDDDEVAIMGMQRAIRKLNLGNPIEIAKNGEEALAKLRARDEQAMRKPFVITLDLNMPRMNGFEFLDAVRHDNDLRDAVVFVVSTSDAEKDIMAAYSQNIAGYIVKDDATETLRSALGLLKSYCHIVRLPEAPAELRMS